MTTCRAGKEKIVPVIATIIHMLQSHSPGIKRRHVRLCTIRCDDFLLSFPADDATLQQFEYSDVIGLYALCLKNKSNDPTLKRYRIDFDDIWQKYSKTHRR